MKKIHVAIASVALAAAAGGAWLYSRAEAKEAPQYRLSAVERGNVSSTVSATGSLSAVRTVQVGTQVSGQVSAIYVDFNDRVKKGQLLARIDPTLQQQAVSDAEAGVQRAQAQLAQAQQEYDREKQLFDAKIVTASEFGTIDANYRVAKANLTSAQVALERARKNLGYTEIYAPIDGVVVERDVDVGQTVAASLSAPQLFVIANDLSQMQILASVDESDIGQIEAGQPVTFTVQSYPNQSFTGSVQQVRLQSKTQDNVVNYTVVIAVSNTQGKLLPGMTATVEFQTAEAKDVLTVPNAALRIRPTVEMQAQVGTQAQSGAKPDSAQRAAWRARRDSAGGGRTAGGRTAGASAQRPSVATLWLVDSAGKLTTARVRTGLTDGQRTEVRGQGIDAGMQVIIGVTGGTATTSTQGNGSSSGNGTNPLQPQRPNFRGGAGGPPGGM